MLELDEDAHQHYSIHCDTTRPFRIHETLALEGNTLPIVIIRLNPDVCKIDGKPKRIYKIDRYKRVLELMQQWDSDAPLSVVYCYYPTNGGKLTIEAAEDFNPHLRQIMTILPEVTPVETSSVADMSDDLYDLSLDVDEGSGES